jgi:hypothetical protein
MNPDYCAMSSGDLLNYMEDDARKWASAFCQIAAKLGHPGIDEGWMLGWFANAIGHSNNVRRWRREAIEACWDNIDEAFF